jgi:hypothetical protein
MAQAGRTVPPGLPANGGGKAGPFVGPPSSLGPPEGLRAVEAALARGLATLGEALAALDRAVRLLDDLRWLLESLADPKAMPPERLAAMRGFAAARLRLRSVCDGVALLDGSLPRGLRVITGIDAGAITVAPVDIRPAIAALAEAPSARVAAAMLSPHGAVAEAERAVAAAQRRLAADQRRLRNRQSLNAALALAWGDGAVPAPPALLQRLAALLRPWAPAR